MNEGNHTPVVSAVRWWVVLQFAAILFMVSGCGLGGGAPPPEGQLAIENIAKWYQLYRADNRGQSPPNEEAFIQYCSAQLLHRSGFGCKWDMVARFARMRTVMGRG